MFRSGRVLLLIAAALLLTSCASQPPRPAAVTHDVPSVVGMGVGRAVSVLAHQGYGVSVEESGEDYAANVKVLDQYPASGPATGSATETVFLTVSAYSEGLLESADLWDAHAHQGTTFYALVLDSYPERSQALARAEVAGRYLNTPPFVDAAEHYKGIKAVGYVVAGAYENKMIADSSCKSMIELGFKARVVKVTKTCSDPIQIDGTFPDI